MAFFFVRLYFGKLTYRDNKGPMNLDKLLRIEAGFHAAQRAFLEIAVVCRKDLYIIIGSFQVLNFGCGNDTNNAIVLYNNSLLITFRNSFINQLFYFSFRCPGRLL